MRNGSLWINTVFVKEVISPSKDTIHQAWSLFIMHLKAHKFVQQCCLFLHYSCATLTTNGNWVQIFTDLLFYAYMYVGKHQVRCLVFDNNQMCRGYTNEIYNNKTYNLKTKNKRNTHWRALYCFILSTELPTLTSCNQGELVQQSGRSLETLDTFGNCQRPVFSHGVCQHKITKPWKFELNWSSKLQDNNGRKKTHQSCLLSECLIFGPQNLILRFWNRIQKF